MSHREGIIACYREGIIALNKMDAVLGHISNWANKLRLAMDPTHRHRLKNFAANSSKNSLDAIL